MKLAYIVMSSNTTVESVWDNEADAVAVWEKKFKKIPSSNIIVRIMNEPIMLGKEQEYRNSLHEKMRQSRTED